MGAALLANVYEDTRDERERATPEVVQTSYAFCGLLLASLDDELAPDAVSTLTRLKAQIESLRSKQVENLQQRATLFPESSVATELFTAACTAVSDQPETDAARWARMLGLDLPESRWDLALTVPGTGEGEREDVIIIAGITHTPGNQDLSQWSLQLGSINAHFLGRGGGQKPNLPGWDHGEYNRSWRSDSGPETAGAIDPAEDLLGLPRVTASLERAHRDPTYDRSALTANGRPGRLITPTKKKLIAWLEGEG